MLGSRMGARVLRAGDARDTMRSETASQRSHLGPRASGASDHECNYARALVMACALPAVRTAAHPPPYHHISTMQCYRPIRARNYTGLTIRCSAPPPAPSPASITVPIPLRQSAPWATVGCSGRAG